MEPHHVYERGASRLGTARHSVWFSAGLRRSWRCVYVYSHRNISGLVGETSDIVLTVGDFLTTVFSFLPCLLTIVHPDAVGVEPSFSCTLIFCKCLPNCSSCAQGRLTLAALV